MEEPPGAGSTYLELKDYHMNLEPFRSTHPTLDSGPARTVRLESTHQLYESEHVVQQIVKRICHEYSVEIQGVFYYRYASHFDKNQHGMVVSIAAKARPGHIKDWGRVCQEVAHDLKVVLNMNLYVELMDQDNVFLLQIHPILDDDYGHRIGSAWQQVYQPTLSILKSYLSNGHARCMTLCVFLSINRLGKMMPTILVGIRYPSKADWNTIKREVMNVFDKEKLIPFELEFVYMNNDFPSANGKGLNLSTARQVTEMLTATTTGDSLGIKDQTGSGSVGLAILLDDPAYNKPRPCMLTCHHVTRIEDGNSDDKIEEERFEEALPLQSRDSKHAGITMMYSPSPVDFEITENDQKREELATAEATIEKYQAEPEWSSNKKILEYQKQRMAWAENIGAWLDSKRNLFGRTIASSGMRLATFKTHNNNKTQARKMDWAIIEVDPARFWPTFAHKPADIPPIQRPLDRRDPNLTPLESDALEYVTDQRAVSQILDPTPGSYVVMRGSTSGYQGGLINYIRLTSLSWAGITTEHEAWVVVSQTAGQVFGTCGDSGSCIFDRKGKLVAMEIAEFNPRLLKTQHYTIITPMSAILKDIEEQTRCKVVLPTVEQCEMLGFGTEIAQKKAGKA